MRGRQEVSCVESTERDERVYGGGMDDTIWKGEERVVWCRVFWDTEPSARPFRLSHAASERYGPFRFMTLMRLFRRKGQVSPFAIYRSFLAHLAVNVFYPISKRSYFSWIFHPRFLRMQWYSPRRPAQSGSSSSASKLEACWEWKGKTGSAGV